MALPETFNPGSVEDGFVVHKYSILFQVKMGFSFPLSLHVFVAVFTWQLAAGVTNLLANPSFENDLAQTWIGTGFDMERYTGDAVEGSYSVKCSGRCVN